MMDNPWFINISCSILLPVIWFIINYFTDEKITERKKLKMCKKAIYNMIKRFNISVGTSGQWGPVLTFENYVLILYEINYVMNGLDSSNIDETDFKQNAKDWYNEYYIQKLQSAIEIYDCLKISQLLTEVDNYGINGKTFVIQYFPNFLHYYRNCIKFIHNLLNINYYKNLNYITNLLYGSYKLPTDLATIELIKIYLND